LSLFILHLHALYKALLRLKRPVLALQCDQQNRKHKNYICLNLSKPGQRKVTSVFLNKYVTARIGLKRHKKGEKERNTALKGREEKGEEKKRLTFPLVFISSSLEIVSGEKKTRLQRFALKTVKISLAWF
ncbi:hypothetical protein ACROYT_G019664, partial [Oculina patagonica]